MFFIFAPGDRPTMDAIATIASREPSLAIGDVPTDRGDRATEFPIELICDGLAFDVHGLSPFRAVVLPSLRSNIGTDSSIETHSEAFAIAPGSHLSGGARNLPILRHMMAIGATLARELKGVESVAFRPSSYRLSAAAFADQVDRWLGGGTFPVPALISFRKTLDDGLQSDGLAFHTGQELRLEPELMVHGADLQRPLTNNNLVQTATLIGARLIDYLIYREPLTSEEQFVGLDGIALKMRPSVNGKTIRVSHV